MEKVHFPSHIIYIIHMSIDVSAVVIYIYILRSSYIYDEPFLNKNIGEG